MLYSLLIYEMEYNGRVKLLCVKIWDIRLHEIYKTFLIENVLYVGEVFPASFYIL